MHESEHLRKNREAWLRKPMLRAMYADVYGRVQAALKPGFTIEIGGGTGNFKQFAPHVLTSDCQLAPWLDFVADGTELPLKNDTVCNIVSIDVLHHMRAPSRVFGEAERVLIPGGRLIIIEPAITFGSWLFYKLHPESHDMGADPFAETPRDQERNPYDANQAIGTLFFTRHLNRLQREFPALRLVHREWFRFWIYPLSGLFRPWCLVPERALRPLLKLEGTLAPRLGRFLGFQMMAVLERQS